MLIKFLTKRKVSTNLKRVMQVETSMDQGYNTGKGTNENANRYQDSLSWVERATLSGTG